MTPISGAGMNFKTPSKILRGDEASEMVGGRYASLQHSQPMANRNINQTGFGGTMNPSKQLLMQPVLNYSQVISGVQP